MKEQRELARPVQSRPRKVHIVLRDGDVVDGGLYLTDGQALAPYLGTRKNGWVNVVSAVWQREGELHRHAVLQTDHIVIASATDKDYPVQPASQVGVPRAVDLLLDDGTRVQGSLYLAVRQRLSDFLSTCGTFLPLLGARRVHDGDELGDIAVNSGCVRAVRDAKVFEPDGSLAVTGEWRQQRRTPSDPVDTSQPLNRELVRRATGDLEVITPGRANDRRTGEIPLATVTAAAAHGTQSGAPALSQLDRKRLDALSKHWLVRLAVDARLAPPDPRTLSDSPAIVDIWRSVAAANEIAEGELAVIVASTHRLDLADLNTVMPEAIAEIPEKVAKRLGVLPLTVKDGFLTVAVSEPDSFEIEQQLRFLTKLRLRREVGTPADIIGAIDWHYQELARAQQKK